MLRLLSDRIIQSGGRWEPDKYLVSILWHPEWDSLTRVPENLTSQEELAWVDGELRQSLSTGKKAHIHGISVGWVREIFATYYRDLGYYDAHAKCYRLFAASLPFATFSARLPHLMYSRADHSRIQSGITLRETYDASALRSALNEGMIAAIEVREEDIPLLWEMLKKGLIPLTSVARLTAENWQKLGIHGLHREVIISVE